MTDSYQRRLKQLLQGYESTNDCINRQDAIDVLEERLKANGYENTALVSELNRDIGYLRKLPSAIPKADK